MRTGTEIKREFARWLERVNVEELQDELHSMNEKEVNDGFFKDLSFGTGGLRGTIGAGSNRMNIYTVARASQGLADYVTAKSSGEAAIAIAYDSRIKSDLFCKTAAEVFAANGIQVYVFSELMPTPCLSFAVRRLGCAAGVVITASHNPAQYNGYKVYGPDGCQITTEAANAIQCAIEAVDIFDSVNRGQYASFIDDGKIRYIDHSLYEEYIQEVIKQSVLDEEEIDRDVAIVYTPLNGTGLRPVTDTLRKAGFTNITLVPEQSQPDGHFPTCPYPNPEAKEAMKLGVSYCEKIGAELLLATDPDADRCGIAVRNGDEYHLLTGNEVGLLLLDYICDRRNANGTMPSQPTFVKTIVTTDLAEKIASHYGVLTKNVLTGFKFIGEQIGELEKEGREEDYICGFEESYGYLTGTYARDKDAVNAALMICEMFAYYRSKGISLSDKLAELYDAYGYCLNTLHSYEFPGSEGMSQMKEIMKRFRNVSGNFGAMRIIRTLDYSKGIDGLPPSDVIKFILEQGSSVVIRPSGTEPKLKIYLSITSKDEATAVAIEKRIVKICTALL